MLFGFESVISITINKEISVESVAAVTFIFKEESLAFGQFEAVDLSFTVDGM